MCEQTSADMDGGWKQIIDDYLEDYMTSMERNALQRGIEQGMQQGIEQGRQAGQQEGVLQGVRDLLRQTLEVRFGGLPEVLLHKIEQCQDAAAARVPPASTRRRFFGGPGILSAAVVYQGRGLQRLAGVFQGHLGSSQFPQLVIDQRQQLLGCRRIARFDLRQDKQDT